MVWLWKMKWHLMEPLFLHHLMKHWKLWVSFFSCTSCWFHVTVLYNHYYINRINGIHVVSFLKGHYRYIIRYIMVCQLGWKNQYQVGQWPCTEGEYCFFEGFIGSPTLNVDHSFFLIVWFTIAKLTSLMVYHDSVTLSFQFWSMM